MARKKTQGLPLATVSRIAHVEPGIRVNHDAVKLVSKRAEEYIREIFLGAKKFTDHRNGTLIMLKDVEAFLASLE